ncbi:Uncharacterised protein [Mycobacteroides abscessus subsp. abscessus]|nr:Uncharacterised protein [Mycobacteroides abscessus subsp. abscessus]
MACSRATKRSRTSLIPWSISTPSGSRSVGRHRGAVRSPHSTIYSHRMSGARTTTASHIRTPDSSIMSRTNEPRSRESTCRPMPTRCCRSRRIAWPAATTSMSSSPGRTTRRSGSIPSKPRYTAPAAPTSSNGRVAMPVRYRMWSWPALETFPPSRCWPPFRYCEIDCRN